MPIEKNKERFGIGDKVICIIYTGIPLVIKGNIYTVSGVYSVSDKDYIYIHGLIDQGSFPAFMFEYHS